MKRGPCWSERPSSGAARGANRPARRSRRVGFTLAELLVVMAIVAILAAIVLPRLKAVQRKAHAAAVISDFSTIQFAALEYWTEENVFPPGADWGVVPTELVPRLPGGFRFRYGGGSDEVVYRWRVWSTPQGSPGNEDEPVVAGVMLQASDPELLAAITSLYRGRQAFGNATQVVLVVD